MVVFTIVGLITGLGFGFGFGFAFGIFPFAAKRLIFVVVVSVHLGKSILEPKDIYDRLALINCLTINDIELLEQLESK